VGAVVVHGDFESRLRLRSTYLFHLLYCSDVEKGRCFI